LSALERGEAGHTLVEVSIAASLCVLVVGVALRAASISSEQVRYAAQRTGAEQALARGLLEVERSLRATRRAAGGLVLRAGEASTSPEVATATAAASVFFGALTGYDADGRPIFGDGVELCAAPDAASAAGGAPVTSLFKRTWVGSTSFAGPPTRTELLTPRIDTQAPFSATARGTISCVLGVLRTAPDGTTLCAATEGVEVLVP
jgi:hypothetical protein